MIAHSVHLTILCYIVSVSLHATHLAVGTILIAASRSYVGIMSCVTLYQVDRNVSDSPAVCKFLHTIFQGVFGYLLTILSIVLAIMFFSIICKTKSIPGTSSP
jgi:hypothetical protein